MADSDDDDVYVLLAVMLEAAKAALQMAADCTAATSALIGAISEQFPDMSARYEALRRESEATSDIVKKARANCAAIDALILKLKEPRK